MLKKFFNIYRTKICIFFSLKVSRQKEKQAVAAEEEGDDDDNKKWEVKNFLVAVENSVSCLQSFTIQ